jgi:hypothetical protein
MDTNRLLIIAAAVVVALLIVWYLLPGAELLATATAASSAWQRNVTARGVAGYNSIIRNAPDHLAVETADDRAG